MTTRDAARLGQWTEERCVVEANAKVQAASAYDDYKQWGIRNGHNFLSGNAFGRRLKERFAKQKDRACTFYVGLRLKTQVELDAEQAQPVVVVANSDPKSITRS